MRRFLWGVFLLFTLALPAGADLARPETLKDTLIAMEERFALDPRVSDIRIDFEQNYLSYRFEGGAMQISLPDTIHKTLQEAPDDATRAEILQQFIDFTISASHSVTDEGPLDPDYIFPVIRAAGFGTAPVIKPPIDEDFGDYIEDEEEQSTPVALPFMAEMEILFAHDNGQVIQFVTERHLEQLKLSPEKLYNIAHINMLRHEWDVKIAGGDGLYILSLDGNFETGFMLNKPFWDGVDVGLGQVVAIVAARDLVLFVDGEVEGAVEDLRTLVKDSFRQFTDPVSITPLLWENGRWRSLEAPI